MTPEEFIALAETIRFEPPHLPFRLRFSLRAEPFGTRSASLTIEIRGPDAELEPGRAPGLFQSRHLFDAALLSGIDRDFALHMIRRHLHEAVLHEVDEWLTVSGERRWYPHKESAR